MIGVKRPPELSGTPNGHAHKGSNLDKNAALSFNFGLQSDKSVRVHIDPSESVALHNSFDQNRILFHLDPTELDRLQLYWLHSLLQDYDRFTYKGFFDHMAARGTVFSSAYSPADPLEPALAKLGINISLSPYLSQTYSLLSKALTTAWQPPISSRFALLPGIVLLNFRCDMRPYDIKPFLQDITPQGIGASEPIQLIVDYSQVPRAEATLAFFFVRAANPPIFPVKEITILPRR